MLESTRNTWHVSWRINSNIYSTLQFSPHEIKHKTYGWLLTTSSIVYEIGNDQSNMLTWPFTPLKYLLMPEVNRFYFKRVLWSRRLFAHDKIYTNISCVKARKTLIFKSYYRFFKNKLIELGKMKTNIQPNRLTSTMQLYESSIQLTEICSFYGYQNLMTKRWPMMYLVIVSHSSQSINLIYKL